MRWGNSGTEARRCHTIVTVKALTLDQHSARLLSHENAGYFSPDFADYLLLVGCWGKFTLAQMTMNGAGATFPYPIYSKWFDEYAKVDPSVRFNYQSIGSGGGQKQITAQTVDFGASDGPMSDENLAKAPAKSCISPRWLGRTWSPTIFRAIRH